MEYNAKHVHLVVVFSARKCGTSFNYMLELAKNLNATCPVAGNVDIIFFFIFWVYAFVKLVILCV